MTASPAAEIRWRVNTQRMQMRAMINVATSVGSERHPLHLHPSQVDQLRSELMQERSERHDLEMDKSTLERQVRSMQSHALFFFTIESATMIFSLNWRQLKELKSRIADMEGQPRPTAGLTLLENKVQELEERLRSEER